MQTSESKTKISLTIPNSILQQIEKQALADGRNRNNYINQIIQKHLKALEQPKAEIKPKPTFKSDSLI